MTEVDLSNPFSILEHCSVIEPTSSPSLSNNLTTALHYPPDPLIVDVAQDLPRAKALSQDTPQDLAISSLVSPLPNQVSTLEVDLSSFKLTGKRKPRKKVPPKSGPITRLSSGPSSKSSVHD